MKRRPKFTPPPFLEMLERIRDLSKEKEKATMSEIFALLAGRGYAAIVIIFALPFCLPIQIPGFSTLFGLILAFIGLRVFLGRELWWPKWILTKEVESPQLEKWAEASMKIMTKVQKVLHPRLTLLTQNYYFHRLHGLIIFLLALLLSLPLPIPLTNLLCAFPLLFIGLGLLEDDGFCIIIGYLLAALCFGAFAALIIFGTMQLMPS